MPLPCGPSGAEHGHQRPKVATWSEWFAVDLPGLPGLYPLSLGSLRRVVATRSLECARVLRFEPRRLQRGRGPAGSRTSPRAARRRQAVVSLEHRRAFTVVATVRCVSSGEVRIVSRRSATVPLPLPPQAPPPVERRLRFADWRVNTIQSF